MRELSRTIGVGLSGFGGRVPVEMQFGDGSSGGGAGLLLLCLSTHAPESNEVV
jgi:hypothetical protein